MSILSVHGSVLVSADDDTAEFAPYLGLDQRLALARPVQVIPLELTSDLPVEVALNGMTVHALVAVTTRKVAMTVTSDDGELQSIPCNPLAILFCEDAPITAISFTRVAGQATSVKLLLAQKA